jgi:hypothetical protein
MLGIVEITDNVCSAWKSSPKTGKRPRLDWTKTAEDRKFPGPSKTATAVQSSVEYCILGMLYSIP